MSMCGVRGSELLEKAASFVMKSVIYKCVTNNIYLGNGDSVRRYFISLYRLRALASRIGDRGT